MTTVAELTEREFFAWYSLLAEYAAAEGIELSDEHVMRVFTAVQEPGSFALVAQDGDAVVGLAHARPFERLLTGQAGVEVTDLFVTEDARRRGVATMLVEQVRARAQAEQRPLLRWSADPSDPAAAALARRVADASDGRVLHDAVVG